MGVTPVFDEFKNISWTKVPDYILDLWAAGFFHIFARYTPFGAFRRAAEESRTSKIALLDKIWPKDWDPTSTPLIPMPNYGGIYCPIKESDLKDVNPSLVPVVIKEVECEEFKNRSVRYIQQLAEDLPTTEKEIVLSHEPINAYKYNFYRRLCSLEPRLTDVVLNTVNTFILVLCNQRHLSICNI